MVLRHGQHAKPVSIPPTGHAHSPRIPSRTAQSAAPRRTLTAARNFVIVCMEVGPLRCEASRESTTVHTSDPSARIVLAFLLTAVLWGAASGAQAQAYPNRPIHIIAPFPAGGGYDFLSRLVGSEMTKTFSQPVIVENKSGANGNIGTDAAAKSAPDGYTLLMGGNSPLSLNVGLYPKLPYDPLRDFEPIARVATQPTLFAANPKVPVKSVAELVQYAKANPGKLSYASNGNGSPQHLAAEQ